LLDNFGLWQPKKLYYFADADKEDIFKGLGPAYSVKELSKIEQARVLAHPRWMVILAHETQSRSLADSLRE